ncbi:MAG: ABC transporter permease [Dysgonamonadaceae bacterium]|jgi:hypothetical protein|nr:ABC transporter permease [Dysgonamonadaceae bacterium]
MKFFNYVLTNKKDEKTYRHIDYWYYSYSVSAQMNNSFPEQIPEKISEIEHFFYPIVISILYYSLCSMEYRNDNYKLLFTLPVREINLYSAKILYLIEIEQFQIQKLPIRTKRYKNRKNFSNSVD